MTAGDEPRAGEQELRDAFTRLAEGEVDALEAVWDLVGEELYAFALVRLRSAADAADVVQEVFYRLGSGAVDLAGVRRPRSWLTTVVYRLSIDVFRRRRREGGAAEGREELFDPVALASASVDAQRASELVARLPVEQRTAVYLRTWGEMSFAEIGSATGVSLFTAASRYRLGLRKLRRWMGVKR